MAWSAPRTWTTAELVTAANMNQEIRDNELELYGAVKVLTAGGTADVITVTTGGAFTLAQGRRVTFVASANNTGNVTLNVDGAGAKSLLKYDESEIPAGGLVAGRAYEAYYDTGGASGRFFLLPRTSGNAVAADVLDGKTFSNDSGPYLEGTMTNNGVKTITPGTSDQSLGGYYASGSKVSGDADLVAAKIKYGENIFGVAGSYRQLNSGSGSSSSGLLTVAAHGLDGTPSWLFLRKSDDVTNFTIYCSKDGSTTYEVAFSTSVGQKTLGNDGTYINSTGFKLHTYSNDTYYWYAVL